MALFSRLAPKIDTDPVKIKALLERGTEDVLVRESLEKKLLSGKQLRIKLGMDPTSPNIHIGRAIALRKLKAFQDLGHKVIFLIGDFTALIGDPSDKLAKRPMLAKQSVEENLKTYKKQVAKVLDVSKAEFVYNSTWLSKLTFAEICELAEAFTVQQMIERRNFKDRLDKGEEISLREFMYPLMQGYDSVPLKADVELGGFDQLFNLKAGRVIQKHYGLPEQDIMTVKMLEGTDGRKMSSSWGNVINLTDDPNDMFGKVMSLRDELIVKYFDLCTDLTPEEIHSIEKELASGVNPRDMKVRLGKEIVGLYHGKEAALAAVAHFENVFKKGGVPDDAPQAEVASGTPLVDVLVKYELVSSKSEYRRLIEQGGVSEVGGAKLTDPAITITKPLTLKIGARRFIKIKVK